MRPKIIFCSGINYGILWIRRSSIFFRLTRGHQLFLLLVEWAKRCLLSISVTFCKEILLSYMDIGQLSHAICFRILQQCTWPCTYTFRLFVLLFLLFIRFLLFQHSYFFLQIIWLDKYYLFYSQLNNNWAFVIFSLVLDYTEKCRECREMKWFFPCKILIPCFSCSWVVAYYFCMFVLELM